LTEFPTTAKCVRKHPICLHQLLDARKDQLEVMFHEVLEKAGGDGSSEIRVGAGAPTGDKSPDVLRVGLDAGTNGNDRLPPGIFSALTRCGARQDRLGVAD
jgi:hypothetical protein